MTAKIIAVFGNEIPNIKSQLDMYKPHASSPIDYSGDVEILNAVLINYKCNLPDEKNLENMRLKN